MNSDIVNSLHKRLQIDFPTDGILWEKTNKDGFMFYLIDTTKKLP